MRKVLLVGVPSMFPGRGGNAQLVWGLLVCFATFGMYMMYAPFIRDSDDTLQQLAQVQIFLTMVASIGLRMTPPDETLGTIISVLLFCMPVIAISMEMPIYDEMLGAYKMLRNACSRAHLIMGFHQRPRVKPAPTSKTMSMVEPLDEVQDIAPQ
jgi:hypothetical protein